MRARSLLFVGTALLATATLPVPSAGAVEFDHDAHNKKAQIADCTKCHKPAAVSIVPDKSVCLDCHGDKEMVGFAYGKLRTHGAFWFMEHELAAKDSNAKCASCHEQKFCLQCHKGDPKIDRPKRHLADFLETHPIRAFGNSDTCRKCHELKFCTDCHQDFRGDELMPFSHRKGWSSLPAGGINHQTRYQGDPNSCRTCHPGGILSSHEWTNGHEKEARRSLTSCQACHPQGDVCKRCHSATQGLKANPHPKDWKDNHDRLARASDQKSCKVCHKSKGKDPVCQRCH